MRWIQKELELEARAKPETERHRVLARATEVRIGHLKAAVRVLVVGPCVANNVPDELLLLVAEA